MYLVSTSSSVGLNPKGRGADGGGARRVMEKTDFH